MSTKTISQDWNFLNPQQAAFAAMIPEMTVSTTANPRRFVGHPSGWRFIVERGCFGPIVLAAAPGYALSGACHRVEGPAEAAVIELLKVSRENV